MDKTWLSLEGKIELVFLLKLLIAKRGQICGNERIGLAVVQEELCLSL